MENYEVQDVLINAFSIKEVHISGNSNHFQIIVVSDIFNNVSLVKRQQIVYAPLMMYITNNCIHALSIKAYTIEEWERKKIQKD